MELGIGACVIVESSVFCKLLFQVISTMPVQLRSDDNFTQLHDEAPTIKCPHCGVLGSALPISVPRFGLMARFKLEEVGMVSRCGGCNRAIFLLYRVKQLSNIHTLHEDFEIINRGVEPFETQYLAGAVLSDFNEALICYASSCWNAFAAMCRRCIQSVCESFGADGTSKVQSQLKDLQEMGVADEETFALLHQIMLSGHDGAHPHLPALSPARGAVLLHLMKDVLYQLYVRPAKIREAGELRKQASGR
jgi:hypothetical protein